MSEKSPYHVVENALQAVLAAESGLAGVPIYKGDAYEEKQLPRVTVVCDSASTPGDLPDGLGNFNCSVRIIADSSTDDGSDPLGDHRKRIAAIQGIMAQVQTIKAAFATQGDAYCYDATFKTSSPSYSDRDWTGTLTYDVLIALAPLAP
jgi:hypothetical protein